MRSLYFIFVVCGCMLLITLSKASTTDSQSDNSTEQTTQTTLTTTTTQTEPTSTETTYQASTAPICNCSLYPPTTIPSTQQSTKPTAAPTNKATPKNKPTPASTNKPTPASTNKPPQAPTTKLTTAPTNKATTAPTTKSTTAPTNKATTAPTNKPTPVSTNKPTPASNNKPTQAPTTKPTTAPTNKPTTAPTNKATTAPTNKPTTATTTKPTTVPTNKPTKAPTNKPTTAPTNKPTTAPTNKPTTAPTTKPTTAPTNKPTTASTNKPTTATTTKPTTAPTNKPTKAPTNKPTTSPTNKPTTAPTNKPTTASTIKPTTAPTNKPTTAPTNKPTTTPTNKATTAPTTKPTTAPTAPTNKPTTATANKPIPAPINKAMPAPGSNIISSNQHDKEFFAYIEDEGNSTTYSYCYDRCNNRTDSTSTTSAPAIVTTQSPVIMTTKKIRKHPANLNGKTVEVDLVVIMKGNFTAVVPQKNSPEYDNFTRQFSESLTDFYQNILGNMFKRIAIHAFSEGSIKCNYTVEMAAPTNETEANALFKDLKEANWTLLNTTVIGAVLEDETRDEQNKILVNVDNILYNLCGKQEVLRFDSSNNGSANCVYKCDINKTDCGSHGYCVVTYTGDVKCLCKDDTNNVYHGVSCNKTVPVDGPTTVKTVVVTESLSRTDIIAIAAGTGGGLVLLLLISLVCVCRKLQSSKKRNKFYSYMGNDKEALHSENSRIENVPNLKNDHTNMAYVRDTDYMQLQRFEPEGKNVNHETGQRQGYERDEKSYRKVEAPDVGNVTIYQPSHLKEPIDRQSGASKFDREEVQSYPFHTMDTEKSYKIRRPTVNSDTSIPYN